MKHFWISWVQPTDDHRPLTFPPNESILGWWCSGESDGGRTLCAWVKADDETGAKHEVNKDWPEAEDWRFCDDKELPTVEKMKEHGRFVPPDWSETRISAEHGGNA